MRVYIPDMVDFFSWMDGKGYRYAVLRSFAGFDRAYPAHGAKEDIDFLAEDAALPDIMARYRAVGRKQGVKCDFYNVTGAGAGAYLGGSYYPQALAEKVLAERRRWKDLFFVPGASAHLLSLLYHIAYQKAELSKISIDDAEKSSGSKYIAELDGLMAETGQAVPHTLMSYHRFLTGKGFGISDDAFVRFVQNDYARQWKGVGLFYALIAGEKKGEANLFVIRRIATSTDRHRQLLRFLGRHYKILAVKPVPLMTRIKAGGKMRGGKWRRGGYPCIAVVVYDTSPVPTSAEDRKIHPYVLNSRQFKKREWRDWFTETTGKKPSANPIHSTDNEAEAIGHLPLFFTPEEQAEILGKLAAFRGGA